MGSVEDRFIRLLHLNSGIIAKVATRHPGYTAHFKWVFPRFKFLTNCMNHCVIKCIPYDDDDNDNGIGSLLITEVRLGGTWSLVPC